MGLTSGLAYVCRSCPCNAHNALCNRHGVAPPQTTGDFGPALRYLEQVRPALTDAFVAQRAVWQDGWLTKWPASKQAVIEDSIAVDDVVPGRVCAMVKREIAHSAPKKARLIQYYPNMATQAAFGPEFYAVQKTYSAHFQRAEVFPGVRVTFGSGLNADALGEWMRAVTSEVPNAHFYERDGKNWDSTMQQPHMDVRLAAYRIVEATSGFHDFVRAGFKVEGRDPRGALRYVLEGTVKSGHNDTTLGNSIVNAMIAALSMRALGLTGDIIVAGDDLLAAIAGDFDVESLAAQERAFGIVPECRKFQCPEDVSFISGVWFSTGCTYTFCPKPGRLLARLFWTVRPPAPRRVCQYVNGVVAGLRPTCGDLPVIAAFLDAHWQEGRGVDAIAEWRHRVQLEAAPRTSRRAELMNTFCRRYALSRADVEDCERLLRSLNGMVGFISHPVIDRLMAVDLADAVDRPTSRDL